MKTMLKRAARWLWNQLVQPNPFEESPPQTGPVELWTSRPTLQGERPEMKVAGVQTREEAHRIAANMGLVVYFVLEGINEKLAAYISRAKAAKQHTAA